jgi:SAM-dependent methyltransferase
VLLERLGHEVSTARNVLEYAPTVVTRRILTSHVPHGYHAIDIARHRHVDLIGDATRLPLADGSLDLQVSFHVLEHIPDDAAVIAEMYRVAAPGGVALVQCPFRRGRPTEDDPGAPEKERRARFGHPDHVRLYGDDFTERLAAPGFDVEPLVAGGYLAPDLLLRAAIPATSPIWVLRRSGRRPT